MSDYRPWIDAYLDGELTPEMEKKLLEWLETDRENLRTFVRETHLHQLMRDHAVAHRVRDLLHEEERGPARAMKKSTRRTMPRRGPAWFSIPAVAAAAFLIALVSLYFFSRSEGTREPGDAGARRGDEKARAESGRKLAETERRRKELEAAAPAPDPASREKRQDEIARMKRSEEELRVFLEELKKRQPIPEPVPPSPTPKDNPEPVPPEAPREKPAPTVPSPRTLPAVAKVTEIVGDAAALVTSEGRSPLKPGQDLFPGQGVETAAGPNRVVVVFPDKTRVELSQDTLAAEFRSEGGKRLTVVKGTVFAEVARQPKDQPMSFFSPHGEAKVLGTTLRLVVDQDPKKGMRLEVGEGKVQLKNLAGKTVDVVSGHFAIVAAGGELATKPIPGGVMGALAYWKFDEATGTAALDASGNGNHGTLMGAPRRSNGRAGLALDLDGTKDYVQVPHSTVLNPGSSPWSVSAWIKTRSVDNLTIVFKDNGNFSSYYHLTIRSRAEFSVCAGDAGGLIAQGTTAINDGKWHHVTGVRISTSTIQLYVDGVVEATKTFEGAKAAIGTNSPLRIGLGNPSVGLHYFAGSIDEVGIYNRALSADEVKRLYLGR